MESPTNISSDNRIQPVKTTVKENENKLEERTEMCQKWLEKCAISDDCSVYSDSDSSLLTETTDNSAMDSGFVFQNKGVVIADRIISHNASGVENSPVIIKETKDAKYDVNIYKSKKVHVGDVTYINGTVIISNNNSMYSDDRVLPTTYTEPPHPNFFINRLNWLAQPPLGEREYLNKPVNHVIIAHTATEEGFAQADNTLLVRLIQTFHVESRKWKDIAYNFLIGSDGLAYEGRGWNIIGSHTRNYNSRSIGIAFIGCFINHLPPQAALDKAQALIQSGVEREFIAPDYKLLAHCQCSPIESPGRRLFEEIQTWKNFDKSVSVAESNFTCEIDEPPDDPVDAGKLPESKIIT